MWLGMCRKNPRKVAHFSVISMKIINLVRQRFGRLLVLSRTSKIPGKKHSQWLCRCECGNSLTVSSNRLTRSITRSCGCLRRLPVAPRFWAKVQKRGVDDCWVWTGNLTEKNGYGRLRVSGQMVCAHRVSWELHNGLIPEGLLVLHKCDNPPCCNPAHLFLGTHKDNSMDAIAKSRHAHGERAGTAVLTADQVREIRTLYSTKQANQPELAVMFNQNTGNISRIIRREMWGSVV
jgi:hypothetical protein